jgi:8-oxo-dGTP pyrophosphatase MutT (NUDIX family)
MVTGRWLVESSKSLAFTNEQAQAVRTVASFVPSDEAQVAAQNKIIAFAELNKDALNRSCLDGHFTGSSWVVNHEGNKGLILLHAKIKRWLQPGGHADGDACLAGVALKEATEETGIAGLKVWSNPIDLDVHLFQNRAKVEPDHWHLDARFLIQAPEGASEKGNHESDGLRWIGEEELEEPELQLDPSTQRLARYGFALIRHLDEEKNLGA